MLNKNRYLTFKPFDLLIVVDGIVCFSYTGMYLGPCQESAMELSETIVDS